VLAGSKDQSRSYRKLREGCYDLKKLMLVFPMLRINYAESARQPAQN
jgi:hypothetical protein